jgi:hypothetical protein
MFRKPITPRLFPKTQSSSIAAGMDSECICAGLVGASGG